MKKMAPRSVRTSPGMDHRIILDLVRPGSSVLDLGCGNGDLLALLVKEKGVKAQGIEIDDQAIFECVAKGLSVFHDDIDRGLSEYGDSSFDYVILNQSFQQVRKPDMVLKEALRVGARVVIGIPNFAYIRSRLQIFFGGRTPVTPALPYKWHDTPNLHFLSILDFIEYCREGHMKIGKAFYISGDRPVKFLPNLLAETGIFILEGSRGKS